MSWNEEKVPLSSSVGDTPQVPALTPTRPQGSRGPHRWVAEPQDGLHDRTQPTSRKGIYGHLLLLTSVALLPGVLGVAFYLSLALKAPSGEYHNGIYVRPIDEGTKWWKDKKMSPLFISSLSSSTIDYISGFVTLLLAYHLGHLWLQAQVRNKQQKLPTSYQYYLTMNLINSPAPISLLSAFSYLFKNRTFRSRKTHLAPIFLLSLVGTFLVLALSSAIKALDLVLHNDISPTALPRFETARHLSLAAGIAEGCLTSPELSCPVSSRANEAHLGALNISDMFRIYQGQTDSTLGSLAFIAPSTVPDNVTIYNAHTFAAGTTCKAYHPSCSTGDMTSANFTLPSCRLDTPELNGSPIYNYTTHHGFDVSDANMKNHLQMFLLNSDSFNLTFDNGLQANALQNGGNMNPLNFVTFGCFDSYTNIRYDQGSNPPFETPFLDWYSVMDGLFYRSPKLCSISVCNTTLYDASYSGQAGKLVLNTNNMQMVNQSATVALSGAAVYVNTSDTSSVGNYDTSNTYMDEMLQVDLTAAGNENGNNTEAFAAAWGMSISSRLLGWSAKAVELQPSDAGSIRNETLALSIPLASAYAYTIVHFVYAALIILLGVSCAFIPTNVVFDGPSQEYRDGKRPTDVRATQTKLSDFSTLLLEVHDARGTGAREQRPLRSRSATSLSISDADEQHVDGRVRLGLKRRSDGTLGLDFHDE